MHPFCMLPVSLLYILYKFSNLNRTLVSNSCTVTLAFWFYNKTFLLDTIFKYINAYNFLFI